MKRALGMALAGVMLLPLVATAQTDVPAPWDAEESITVNSSVVPGVLVMSRDDFCRAMALLLQLYEGDETPSEEQVAACARVISEQMVTQAWVPQTWNRLIDPSKAPATPTAGRMTVEEASAFYQQSVRRANLALSEWNCATEKARSGLSWKQNQSWSKRYAKAANRWDRQLRSVEWPKGIDKKVDRLLDRNASEAFRRKDAFQDKSFLAAVSSGDWARYTNASDKSSEAAQQVRAALGIPPVPQGGSDCKQVKRLKKLIRQG